jgi:hypothetical protein
VEPGNFYRPADVHRMILLFDLEIEFFAYQQEVDHGFIPDEGKFPTLDKRR